MNISRGVGFARESFRAARNRQRRKFRRRVTYAVVNKRVLRLVAQVQIRVVYRDYPCEGVADCVACLVVRADLLIVCIEESRVRHFVIDAVNRERVARFQFADCNRAIRVRDRHFAIGRGDCSAVRRYRGTARSLNCARAEIYSCRVAD